MAGSFDYLTAQLKVNLRPLWSPAASALSSLSSRFGDLVWGLLFQEVQNAASPTVGHTSVRSSVVEGERR